ncbi:MAG: HAMP domain-containing histidine kinase [Cyclobacteriaceae bacterium]|nr:HAMP domain-containing histidine kinase [Cyclobacteriaceae bacterium]
MEKLTDEELLKELKKRFEMNKRMVYIHKELMNDLRKANDKLLASEKVQTQFLSNIRNEINNPLTSIMGLSQELASEKSISKQCSRKIDLIFSEASKLEFQMQNIIVAAELEAGESPLYVVKVDVDSLIKSVIQSFEYLSTKKNIKVIYKSEFPKSEKTFNTDSDKLKIILSNLVMNALEFSDEKSEIFINAKTVDANTLIISVVDTGEGIDKDNFDKIFGRFIQLDSGSTKKHLGHGIGLSVVKSLIDSLEAEINVKSKINKGSTFTITIPQGYIKDQMNSFSNDGDDFLFFDDSDVEVI